jgi:hypothetical protein
MVTANDMFRPLKGHHQVVHEKGSGLCNVRTLYSPQPPSFSLGVQPDDGLLQAETCSR